MGKENISVEVVYQVFVSEHLCVLNDNGITVPNLI